MLSRRNLLKSGAAGVGLTLLGAPSILRAQGAPFNLMTPFAYGPNFIDMINAWTGGHFAANGVDVVMEAGRGGSQTLQQLVAGKADMIRISGIEQLRAIDATGTDLVSLATLYQASTFHVVSLKDKPIAKAEDFDGKTVGLVSVGGSTEIFLDLMLRNAGVPAENVIRETTGDTPSAFEVMQAGRVDAFICSINVVVALRMMDAPVEVWSTDRYAPMPGQCFVALRDKVDAAPEVYTNVLKGLTASVQELINEPTGPIFDRAAKVVELPGSGEHERLSAIIKTTATELWLGQGEENLMKNVPSLFEAGYNTLTNAGMLTKTVDPSIYYRNDLIEKTIA